MTDEAATDRLVVITGGPGAGKTTLIEALAVRGHAVRPEAGRAIIRDQQAIDAYDARCREVAAIVLAKAREAATAARVACETLHVENRAPAKAILETAKARGADLIVLTSHGRHGLERFLLGSQAQRVVQGAETSVLVVR